MDPDGARRGGSASPTIANPNRVVAGLDVIAGLRLAMAGRAELAHERLQPT